MIQPAKNWSRETKWTNADCGCSTVNPALQWEVCTETGEHEIFVILKLKLAGKCSQLCQALFLFFFLPKTTFSHWFYYLDLRFPNRCRVCFWTYKCKISQHCTSTLGESMGRLPKATYMLKLDMCWGKLLSSKNTVIQNKTQTTQVTFL